MEQDSVEARDLLEKAAALMEMRAGQVGIRDSADMADAVAALPYEVGARKQTCPSPGKALTLLRSSVIATNGLARHLPASSVVRTFAARGQTLAGANGSAAQPDTAALPVVTWRDPVSSAPEGVAGIQSVLRRMGTSRQRLPSYRAIPLSRFRAACHGDPGCQCGTHIVVPIRRILELIRKPKLSPQMLKLAVVFRLKLPDDAFEPSIRRRFAEPTCRARRLSRRREYPA